MEIHQERFPTGTPRSKDVNGMQLPDAQPDDEVLEFLELLEPEPLPVTVSGDTAAYLSADNKKDESISGSSVKDASETQATDPLSDDDVDEFLELLEDEPIEQTTAPQSSELLPDDEEYEFLELLAPEVEEGKTDFGIQETSPTPIVSSAAQITIASSVDTEKESKSTRSRRRVWRWVGLMAL